MAESKELGKILVKVVKKIDNERVFYESKVKIIECGEEVNKKDIDNTFDKKYTEDDIRTSEEALEKVFEFLKKRRPNKNLFEGVNFI